VIRQLPPWHETIGKRQVKAATVYVRDSGLLHALLNLPTHDDLVSHPKVGAYWEGFIIEEIITQLRSHTSECFFWRTYQGAKLDLLVVRGRQRIGFEIKHTSAPALTPSMRLAATDLKLDALHVIHAGAHAYSMAERIRAVPAAHLVEMLATLE
jgi:predicted AAA+ superfamily ATPase